MNPRKFNPLAAFGVVHPPHNGATHYQDGGYFGPDGSLLFEDRPATPKKKVKSSVIVTDAEAGTQEETEVEDEVETTVPGEPKVILAGWLKGEVQLTHPATVKLVKAGYDIVLAKKADIIDYLVNTANLVPAELVKVK